MADDDDRTDIWMPMYWGDYLRDTSHLGTLEHGAYLLLIAHYWVTGEPLPDDDRQLRNIAKISPHHWKKFRLVLQKFFCVKNGHWHHKRIDTELRKAAENKEKRRKKAAAAANARWKNEDARGMLGACPSPSPSEKEVCDSSLRSESTPVGGENGQAEEDRNWCFTEGARYLYASGETADGSRACIAEWLNQVDPTTLRAAIGTAQVSASGKPRPYIAGIVRRARANDVAGSLDNTPEWERKAKADWERGKRAVEDFYSDMPKEVTGG